MVDKRKGLIAASKKWGSTTWFFVIIGLIGLALALWFGIYSCFLGATKKGQDKIRDEVKQSKEIIIEEINNLYARLKDDGEFQVEDIQETAKRTYEIAENLNANLIVKKGYEKKGGFGTWFTPSWDAQPSQQFYLADFVGDLHKNRISVFITEKSILVCQILTSDGRNEKISVDIASWKKGEPYLIIVQWNTTENRVELYVNKKKYERIIPDLNFDKLGPILFVGIDFEGKYPAKLKRGGPKISEGLKAIGFEEFKPANN